MQVSAAELRQDGGDVRAEDGAGQDNAEDDSDEQVPELGPGPPENKAKIVAGTKTLHHLLPDLVVPMDRAWTGTFFRFHLPEWQDPASQRRIFELAYTHFVVVAQRAQPAQYVTGQGWRTSRSKVIDNALIGYCEAEFGEQPPVSEGVVNQISFDVAGYPPIKNEALSMLSANHPYAGRVQALLEAADQARQAQGFVPIDAGPIALDVVVHTSSGQNPADATNYLGGIGDVLQDKSSYGLADGLGRLVSVWLYRNDQQIKQVTYRETESSQAGYTVTIRALESG